MNRPSEKIAAVGVATNCEATDSKRPITTPPTSEPAMLPMPPSTTTMKLLMPKASPTCGVTGMKGAIRQPITATVAQPRPKVRL